MAHNREKNENTKILHHQKRDAKRNSRFIYRGQTYLRVTAQSHNCHSHSTLPFACEYDCRNHLCVYLFFRPLFLPVLLVFESAKFKRCRDGARRSGRSRRATMNRAGRTSAAKWEASGTAARASWRHGASSPFCHSTASAVDARARKGPVSPGPFSPRRRCPSSSSRGATAGGAQTPRW